MPRNTQAATLAKNNPVRSRRGKTETGDHTIGQDRPRIMKSRGPARQSLESAVIEPVDRVVSKKKLDALAFNEELITIRIADATNENDNPIPAVWNGGVSQYFERGKEQTVKRKFVEVLARMKRTVYRQDKVKDANGDSTYRQIPQTALVYPFSVIEDPNPRGSAWLRALLNEA